MNSEFRFMLINNVLFKDLYSLWKSNYWNWSRRNLYLEKSLHFRVIVSIFHGHILKTIIEMLVKYIYIYSFQCSYLNEIFKLWRCLKYLLLLFYSWINLSKYLNSENSVIFKFYNFVFRFLSAFNINSSYISLKTIWKLMLNPTSIIWNIPVILTW